ncbi:RNA polymerase-associated protein LEO1-like [Bacillus rossius redtenbacheri]|uniref:RNA polymerase-associated protein LEO1-like n=1 Tax=Bacillus rossius redtenbacheri TaxID=93214 RepID=UPI002FDE6117
MLLPAVLCCWALVAARPRTDPCLALRLSVAGPGSEAGRWSAALGRLQVSVQHSRAGPEGSGQWEADVAYGPALDCEDMRGAEGSGHEGSGHEGSGHEGSGHEDSGHEGSGHEGSGHEGSGHEGSGHEGSGHEDSGQHEGSGHQLAVLGAEGSTADSDWTFLDDEDYSALR